MARENEHDLLLGEESETASPAPRSWGRRAGLGVSLGAIAGVALWRSGAGGPPAQHGSVSHIMSAVLSDALTEDYGGVCAGVEGSTDGPHWPHRFEDVNWEGHCSDGGDMTKCEEKIVAKYVGDFFDAFLAAADKANKNDQIPKTTRELQRWKDRVIEEIQEEAKKAEEVTVPGPPEKTVLLLNALQTPKELSGTIICEAIIEQRPLVVAPYPVMNGANLLYECRPNYVAFGEVEKRLETTVPAALDASDDAVYTSSYPADLSSTSNSSLEACRRFLRQDSLAADWIEASLAALDVRECLRSGGAEQQKYSRSWVSDCIPFDERGFPGQVFEFLSAYGAPGDDCIPNYGGLEKGHCPSQCQSGASLAGHLKRPDEGVKLIYAPNGAKFETLTDDHQRAKQHIWNGGPVVGLIHQNAELAACARDDHVIFPNGCDTENWDGTLEFGMHSVVVYGWGSEGGQNFYRILTYFQGEDHEARIHECAVKMFVIPETEKGLAQSDYDEHLQAIKAEARCPRNAGFCNGDAGYTDTEDCDGDGVLDHWCYSVGDAETPTYEAYISSRTNCATVEQSCRRSVLPGRHFGCQRPLAWCMHGEHYHRDVDCDGDGHFDHVCEKEGHAGYIASSEDCKDTWEEGTAGRKCDPRPILAEQDASVASYKLVSDYGNCVESGSPQCFVSHAEFPTTDYPVGVCQFHVEWTQAGAEETLYLEVVQMEIETARFNDNGWAYGERLEVNGVNTRTTVNTNTEHQIAEFIAVKDKDEIKWSTDQSVQEAGWLVCLRLKKKIPKVHVATCSEIGDDIWSAYFTTDDPKDVVSVECDMTKCNKAKVKSVAAGQRYTFVRTTNVCDAGWQAARSSKFDLVFAGPSKTTEATFEVLL